MKRTNRVFLAVLALWTAAAQQQTGAQGPVRYTIQKITDGVLLAVPTVPGPNAANVPLIAGEDDVILVGTHLFPADARSLIEQVRKELNKSVRYIVNTHYHAVPTAAGESFPAGVEVIGHELARRTLLTDSAGKPRPPRATVAPPTVGMTTRLVLYRGDREVRILYVGRGHSDNDLIVLLPKERIICTGDLLVPGLPDMSGGNVTDWISTLESLKLQDFDMVLPARGAPFKGKTRIDALQGYLRDVVSQTTDLLNKGLSVEETARRVDLTAHSKEFPEIKGPGLSLDAVRRLQTQIEPPPPPFEAQ
jgi:glyoxylase-like metal-dependent hydrolase (beta-lactamase superfamily II)